MQKYYFLKMAIILAALRTNVLCHLYFANCQILNKLLYFQKIKMGLSLRKKRFKIIDMTGPDRCFNYLRSKGKITRRKDDGVDVIHLQMFANGYYTGDVWLKHKPRNDKLI